MIQIKICGLTRDEDITAVNHLLPDYIGFVFAKSRRQVTPKQAHILREDLDSRIKAVGVFVNEQVQSIAVLCRTGVIDAVQLHGDETEEFIAALKQETSHPVIKAIRVQNVEQILKAERLSCDMLLLDTYQKGHYGGSGKTFDRSLIPILKKPFFMAGGLNSSNIAQVALEYDPFGVDVSSGVETDGLKDVNKIRQIIDTIRNLR